MLINNERHSCCSKINVIVIIVEDALSGYQSRIIAMKYTLSLLHDCTRMKKKREKDE